MGSCSEAGNWVAGDVCVKAKCITRAGLDRRRLGLRGGPRSGIKGEVVPEPLLGARDRRCRELRRPLGSRRQW